MLTPFRVELTAFKMWLVNPKKVDKNGKPKMWLATFRKMVLRGKGGECHADLYEVNLLTRKGETYWSVKGEKRDNRPFYDRPKPSIYVVPTKWDKSEKVAVGKLGAWLSTYVGGLENGDALERRLLTIEAALLKGEEREEAA